MTEPIIEQRHREGLSADNLEAGMLGIPMVIDRANGAKGSYAIRRFRQEVVGATAEYWNLGKWAAFCYVFTDKKLADCVCELLRGGGDAD